MPFARPFLAGAAVCALLAAAPSSGAASTVVPASAGQEVRALGSTLVFSTYGGAAQAWRLAVRENGVVRVLNVAPSPVSFEADIGTDSAGAPEVIYRRCAGREQLPTGCDLSVIALAAGAAERPVANANDPAQNDVTPTIWRGRIAWTRQYGTMVAPNPVVYTKTLTAPRSQPSRRLPGVPTQRCATELGLVDPPCGPTKSRSVSALELWGDHLGLIVRYAFDGLGGISQTEVRLDGVAAGTSREISYLTSGLAAQFFAGPSFGGGKLAWYKACGDASEPSCKPRVGPWRYALSSATYQQGAPGPVAVYGFADTGTRLYEALGCDMFSAAVTAPVTCRIDSVAPPAYTTVPAPDLATATPPTR